MKKYVIGYKKGQQLEWYRTNSIQDMKRFKAQLIPNKSIEFTPIMNLTKRKLLPIGMVAEVELKEVLG